jgi:hypothetical protein
MSMGVAPPLGRRPRRRRFPRFPAGVRRGRVLVFVAYEFIVSNRAAASAPTGAACRRCPRRLRGCRMGGRG